MEKLDKHLARAMHILNNSVYGSSGFDEDYFRYIEKCKLIDHRTNLINKLINKYE